MAGTKPSSITRDLSSCLFRVGRGLGFALCEGFSRDCCIYQTTVGPRFQPTSFSCADANLLVVYSDTIEVTAMENLPPELLRRILLYLIAEWSLVDEIHESVPKTSLAVYATISRKWQSTVEPFTFRYLALNPMRLDVAEAYNYLTPPRLAHLRHVRFEIEFPAHDLHVSTDPEDYDDQIIFTKTIRRVLGLLARVPRRQTSLVSLILLTSPSREHCIPWVGDRPTEKDKVFSGELRKTYLELPADWDRNIEDLSEISLFRVELESRALVFAPASINMMASKMTRLKKVEWWLCDGEKINTELRIRQRTGKYSGFGRTPWLSLVSAY